MTMRFLLSLGLAAGLAGGVLVPGTSHAGMSPGARVADAVPVTLPAAVETFSVGTLRVQRFGDHGRAVILIPGLGSGSWMWADTIRHLQSDHVVYALTLAGFDGVPAPEQKTGLMDQADAALLKLIKQRHIDHPVLVGHSLGGTLAIRFAGEHSNLLSGVVAVDGLPVFPGTQSLSAAERATRAAQFKAYMTAMTASPAQYQAQQMRYMQTIGLLDAAAADYYGKLQMRSDPAMVVAYGAEDYGADYRPGLAHVSVPLLEISPYNAPDFKKAAKRTGKPVMTAEQKAAYYRSLLAGDAQAQVKTIQPARHFVMLDQPDKFQQVLDAFMQKLAKGP